MGSHLRPAIVLFVLLTAVTGVIYPLAITGIAQVAFPSQANGSLTARGGAVIGSALVGQAFASERYFHPRPSATSAPDPSDAAKTVDAPYNAAASTGSNLGPLSQKLVDRVRGDVDSLKGESGGTPIPADGVTTSASGLDPHISPAYARLQAARVAQARNIPVARVRELVEQRVEGRWFGVIGEPRVNVLGLNLALDALGA